MDARAYEYQSDFARHYIAQGQEQGREVGRAEGRAALMTRLLELRFGSIGEEAKARIQRASIAELEAMGERLLSARTLQEALEIA